MPVKDLSSHVHQDKPLVIGIEFNQAGISTALVDENARVIAALQTVTPQRTTRAAIAAMAQSILELATSKQRGDSPIAAIGISVTGIIDPPTGRVSIPGFKGWTRVAVREMLIERLDESGHDIRISLRRKQARAEASVSAHPAIAIHSRAAAFAAAESWCGAARGRNNVVYLSVGNDIEAGILANGRALEGASGNAGAAGWLTVGGGFNAEYETSGCLSAEATINAMTRRAIEAWGGEGSSMLGGLIKADASRLDAATILRAAGGGDKLAVKVARDTCHWIGRGVANLISILNPDALVIGGELGVGLKPFLDDIREEARRWAAPEAAKQCRIVSASAGANAGVIGAARLAMLLLGSKAGN
ncbi:MAG: ROK family protein [Blastocatellia bacterium]